MRNNVVAARPERRCSIAWTPVKLRVPSPRRVRVNRSVAIDCARAFIGGLVSLDEREMEARYAEVVASPVAMTLRSK